MVDQRLRRFAAAAAVGLALTFSGGLALAQPMGGPHGQGSPDAMLGGLIANAKAQLNLNTSQQAMFDTAIADSKAAHGSAQALHQKVKDALQAELAKAEPDLAAVAGVADGVEQQARTLRQSVRNKWLTLYATFTPEQKAVVRGILQTKIAQGESFRQKMHDRMLEHFGGKSS